MEWQPIETAPKDGAPILVTNPERGGVWVAKYYPVYPSGFKADNPWFNLMLNTRWHPNRWGSMVPTLWMPLPPLPTSIEQAQCNAAGETQTRGV